MIKLSSFILGTLLVSGAFFMASCYPSKSVVSTSKQQKNILWFDATANFHRFTFKDSITYYLQKSKEAGVTDVVVDVKPITGEVLYPSKIAPQMLEWNGGKQPAKKDVSWDMLSFFIEEGHRLGLAVHASTNVFVAGHNFFDRGIVYEQKDKKHWQTISYLPEGMVPITQQKKKYSAMINPALPEVQAYELSILKELVTMYPNLDGIILDRVRYDGITADFSDASHSLFEAYIGKKVANWPADIYSYTKDTAPQRLEGPLYKQWLEWRAKVIHDFFVKARAELKKINPKIIYGDYTGAWYNTYYEVGVNWASKQYNPAEDYAWATQDYQKYGYAETLDLFTTGNYFFEVTKEEVKKNNAIKAARTEAGMEQRRDTVYSVEGSAEIANDVTKGVVPIYAGLYVEQYNTDPEQFVKAMKMCRAKSQGVMIFDVVHIINNGWWKELERGLKEDPQNK